MVKKWFFHIKEHLYRCLGQIPEEHLGHHILEFNHSLSFFVGGLLSTHLLLLLSCKISSARFLLLLYLLLEIVVEKLDILMHLAKLLF